MKGTIRTLLGLAITIGAVSTLDIDFDADVITQTAIACVGLVIAASGISALKRSHQHQ